jgi:hypothetical protein
MSDEFLKLLADRPASERALLDLLRARMNKRIDLGAIAAADYGYDFEKHYSLLERIFDTGDVPATLDQWHPLEVLQLVSYSCPDDPEWRPGSEGERGHLQRAFACAVLLRNPRDPLFDSDQNSTLAALLESCLFLGDEFVSALQAFIVIRLKNGPTPRDNPDEASGRAFFALAFAILFCAAWLSMKNTRTGKRRVEQYDQADFLAKMFVWLVDLGDRADAMNVHEMLRPGSPWLLNSTCFNGRHDVWCSLAHHYFLDRNDALPAPVRDTARLLAESLKMAQHDT